MPQTLAWECPSTGKLFKDKLAYIAHLREIAGNNLSKRRQAKYIANRREFWRVNLREAVSTFEELTQFIFDNWEAFCRNAHYGDTLYKDADKHIFDYSKWSRPKTIELLNLRWSDRVGNTHNAPFNGVTNWGAKPDKPTGYPGWHGSIKFIWDHEGIKRPEKMLNRLPSNYFSGTGIGTGSGSGSTTGCNQQIVMFADDWPALFKHKQMTELARYLAAGNHEDAYKPL